MGRSKPERQGISVVSETLGGRSVRPERLRSRLRNDGVVCLHPTGDAAHREATERLVARALRLSPLETPYTSAAPGLRARMHPTQALWEEAAAYRRSGHQGDYAKSLAALATRLIQQGNVRRAVSCLRVATRLAHQLRREDVAIAVVCSRAEVYFWSGDAQRALPLYRAGAERLLARGDHLPAAEVLLALGDTQYHLEDEAQAEWSWEQALWLYEEAGDLPAQAETRERLAGLALGRGAFGESTRQTEAAMTMYDRAGLFGEAERCRARLDQILEIAATE